MPGLWPGPEWDGSDTAQAGHQDWLYTWLLSVEWELCQFDNEEQYFDMIKSSSDWHLPHKQIKQQLISDKDLQSWHQPQREGKQYNSSALDHTIVYNRLETGDVTLSVELGLVTIL